LPSPPGPEVRQNAIPGVLNDEVGTNVEAALYQRFKYGLGAIDDRTPVVEAFFVPESRRVEDMRRHLSGGGVELVEVNTRRHPTVNDHVSVITDLLNRANATASTFARRPSPFATKFGGAFRNLVLLRNGSLEELVGDVGRAREADDRIVKREGITDSRVADLVGTSEVDKGGVVKLRQNEVCGFVSGSPELLIGLEADAARTSSEGYDVGDPVGLVLRKLAFEKGRKGGLFVRIAIIRECVVTIHNDVVRVEQTLLRVLAFCWLPSAPTTRSVGVDLRSAALHLPMLELEASGDGVYVTSPRAYVAPTRVKVERQTGPDVFGDEGLSDHRVRPETRRGRPVDRETQPETNGGSFGPVDRATDELHVRR
jgi:hypothetical protein